MTTAVDVVGRERGATRQVSAATVGSGEAAFRRRRIRRWWSIAIAAAVVWSFIGIGAFDDDLVNTGGWESFGSFWAAAIRPRADGEFIRLTFDSMLTTASFAIVGSLLAVVIGVVGGVLTSQRWWRREAGAWGTSPRRRPGWFAVRAGLALPRGVHEAIWALVLVSILGDDPLVAVLALALPFGAVTAKVYADLIDEADSAPYDALRVAGAGRFAAVTYAIAPQIGRDVLSYGFYRLECAIRSAVVLGVIGAGGLGFQLALSFQSLRYEEIWTLLYGTIVLAVAAETWSAAIRRGGRRARRVSLLVAAALTVGAWIHLDIDVTTLWSERTRDLFHRYVVDSWPPRLPHDGWRELIDAAVDTMQMSIAGIVVSIICAVPLAFAAARRPDHPARSERSGWLAGSGRSRRSAWRPAIGATLRIALLVLRSVPIPVWALLALFLLHPGPLPGAVALALYNAGILGRLLAEVVENADHRGADALAELGASAGLVTLYGVVPRVAGRFTALSLYRWEVIVRDSVVLGIVGAGGLGQLLDDHVTAFDDPRIAGTVLAFVATTLLVDAISSALRRSFLDGRATRLRRAGTLAFLPGRGRPVPANRVPVR